MTESKSGSGETGVGVSNSGDVQASNLRVSDRYHVVREVGHGGMATVFLARDTRYDRDVAVKVLSSELAAGVAADRFLREVAVVAKLTHPHIIPLLDSGETGGRLWFVMPMVEGDSLRARIERERQLAISDAVRIGREVAAALAYAHAHGVVHRDIKPENVLVSGGSAAVSDFGLVKVLADAAGEQSLTRTGTAVGTTFYMSPEQASGTEVIDGRSDIYSLGCMMYEMLTGEPPFTGKTAQSVMAKHFTDPVPSARRLRGTVPQALDDAIARAMAKLPADRWPDAASFADAMQRAVDSGSHASIEASFGATSGAVTAAGARRRRGVRIVVASAVIALAAVGGWLALRGRIGSGDGGAAGVPRAIAVLPFTNLSTSKDEEYFSVGMTDELLGMLSAIDGLRVAPRASSYAFKDRASDLGEIGNKLNVDAVLDGSVRRDGDEVRVLAELVSVKDGTSLWRGTFTRTMSDVFALQEEVAGAIVSALRLQLTAGHALAQRSTGDVDAYQLYLRARYAWNQRTPASLEQASAWFHQAVERDPKYARAWAGIADVHIIQALNFFAPPGPNYLDAKAAALKALALDSTLADAHASLGTVHFLYDRDWAAAEAEYQRAIALDPSYSTVRYFHALFLSGRQMPGAMEEAQRAMSLDPLAPPIAQATGIVHIQAGRYADAIAPLRAAIALQPQYYFPHTWLAIALAHTGAKAEAVSEAERAVALAPTNTLVQAIRGYVYALTGDRARAIAEIAALEATSRTRPIPYHYVGRIYDALGDADKAISWLERGLEAGEGQLSQLNIQPGMRTIAKDPRFLAILQRLNSK